MFSRLTVIIIVGILALTGLVLADTITTAVRFIIPSDLAFSISTPSNNSTFVTSSTAGLYFNSTTTTITMLNASLSENSALGNSDQDNDTAIFRYRNDGNAAINITLSFALITDTCINVKASVGSLGYQAICADETGPTTNTTCVNWNSTSLGAKNVTDTLAVNDLRDVWLWADFTSCSSGLDETDTITHTSIK